MRLKIITLCICLALGVAAYLINNHQANSSSPLKSSSTSPVGEIADLNVVLIVIDTVGAKHLDLTNRSGPLYLQELAKESVVYSKAYSAAPWTRPAIASIFTGLHPLQHGILRLRDSFKPGVSTLAEQFQTKGYRTAGFVSHELIDQRTAFRQGYETYRIVPLEGKVHDALSSPQVTDSGVAWLKSIEAAQPKSKFHLFLHYFDPHYNYRHHPQFDRTSWYKGKLYSNMSFNILREKANELTAEDIRYLEGLYAEEIAYTDMHIKRFFSFLKSSPFADNTLVIVTADHGEEFKEHGGIGHGQTLYEEVIHVPLLIWAPKHLPAQTIQRWVSTMDIAPSLISKMHTARTAADYSGKGMPLWEIVADHSKVEPKDRHIAAHVAHRVRKQALMNAPYKLISKEDSNDCELFNLAEDSEEKTNICDSSKISGPLSEHQKKLNQILANPDAATAESLTADEDSTFEGEEAEKLKSLGYLG